MTKLDIELSDWILADGNYESVSFDVGAKVGFALEFNLQDYSICKQPLSLTPAERPSFYSGTAEVVYRDEPGWVLNFGDVLAYKTGTTNLAIGDRIQGEFSLHVDPCDYYETLWKNENFPPLIYEWELLGIAVRLKHLHKKNEEQLCSDPATMTSSPYRPIERIHLTNDRQSGSDGSYILHCALRDCRPVSSL